MEKTEGRGGLGEKDQELGLKGLSLRCLGVISLELYSK